MFSTRPRLLADSKSHDTIPVDNSLGSPQTTRCCEGKGGRSGENCLGPLGDRHAIGRRSLWLQREDEVHASLELKLGEIGPGFKIWANYNI